MSSSLLEAVLGKHSAGSGAVEEGADLSFGGGGGDLVSQNSSKLDSALLG